MNSAIFGSKHKSDLTQLFSAIDDELTQIFDDLKEVDEGHLAPEKLESIIKTHIDDTQISSIAFANIILYANALDREDLSKEIIKSDIEDSIDIEEGKGINVDRLIDIASLTSTMSAVKMASLSYDLPSQIDDIKIITDLRPVFSQSRGEAISFIIMNNLQFVAKDKYGTKTHSLSISVEDVRRLQKCCEQALLKVDSLSRTVVDSFKVPVYQPGEDDSRD